MREEKGQSSFLHRDEVSILVLVSQSVQVNNTGDGSSDQPGKTQDSIDTVEETTQHKIVVVSFSVLQLVGLVVDQVPSDTVVQEAKQEGKDSRSSGHNDNPSFSVQVSKVSKPWASSDGFSDIETVVGPEAVTGGGTALERGFKFAGNLEGFGFNLLENELLDQSPDDNRECDGKVVDRGSNTVVAEERRLLEATEEEDQPSGSESKNSRKQTRGEVAVVWVIFIFLMGWVARCKVSEDTSIRERISNGIHDENTDNEKGENLVGESGRKSNHTGQIKKGGEEAVSQQPDACPCVHGQERNIHVVGNVVKSGRQGQNRTSRSDYTL